MKKVKKKSNKTLSVEEKFLFIQKNSFCRDFVEKVYFELKNNFLVGENSKIVVAVSGGIDSVTLLDVLFTLQAKIKLNLIVAHYNHSLRGKEADLDAKFVKNIAEKYGIAFHSSKGNVREFAKAHSLSLENAGRILRYDFLKQISRSVKAEYLATAHNLDDSIETFFINLFRGTGITGLCGIPEQRNIGKNLVLIRPLIKISRAEIEEYARLNSLEWREDSSNKLLHFTRNKIRNRFIPFLKEEFSTNISETLKRTITHLQGVDNFIAEHIQKALPNLIAERKQNYIAVKINLLETYSNFFKGELIQAIIEKYFKLQSLSLSAIDRILKLCKSQTGSVFDINEKLFVLRDRDYLIFSERIARTNFKYPISKIGDYQFENFRISLSEVSKKEIKFSKEGNIEYFDYDKVPELLFLSSLQEGDQFVPLGMKEEVKLSDFLINQKVSRIDKQNIVLLRTKNDIIWVCGYRISDKFKITAKTKRFLKAEFYVK